MGKKTERIGGRWTQDADGAIHSAQFEERTTWTDDDTGEIIKSETKYTMGMPPEDLGRIFGDGGALLSRNSELSQQLVAEREAYEKKLLETEQAASAKLHELAEQAKAAFAEYERRIAVLERPQ